VAPGFVSKDPGHPLQAVSVTADPHRIFLRITFTKEQNIHAVPGVLTLLARDEREAHVRDSGTEIGFDFSANGVSVFSFRDGTRTSLETGVHDLHMVTAPSFIAREFEIGFVRGRTVGAQNNAFSGRVIYWKLIFRDPAGRVLQQGALESRLPGTQPFSAGNGKQDPLRKHADAEFRVVTWNVHNRFFQQNPEPFRRILRALRPDVLFLDEVYDATPEDWIRTFLRSLSPDGKEWTFIRSRSGGWERSLVASHLPLTAAFDGVWHTKETLDRLGPLLEPTLPKRSPPRKDLPDGITAAGAFITIGSRTVLATAVDLACCGSLAESLPNQRREAEVQAIQSIIRGAIGSRNVDGVLTGGDFNLVGSRRALDVLRRNLDRAGSDLAVDDALRLDNWANWTNSSGPGAPFMRGKLDYVLHSPSSLTQKRAFIFDSNDLSATWLRHYRINADDSAVTDHCPIVVDFAWR
jgi:endonuclease/exonuclease/phosphatase family metal-dependent hydrolase